MKGIFITFVLMGFAWANLKAQKSIASFMLQHSVAYPLSNTRDFISNPSFRGVVLDYRYHSSPEFCIGISSGLQTFYQFRENSGITYAANQFTTVLGPEHRYINAVPFFLQQIII